MTTPSHSPVFVVPAQMDFFDALRKVLNGEKITRLEWNDPLIFIMLDGSRLRIMLEDKKLHDLIVSEGDMRGEDWVVL